MSLYETLRSDILKGAYEPGSKLKMETLKERYSSGVNVLRESLARLSSEGLVDSEDQKGFRITPVSSARLSDLTRLRILLECDGAKHSFINGGVEWGFRGPEIVDEHSIVLAAALERDVEACSSALSSHLNGFLTRSLAQGLKDS